MVVALNHTVVNSRDALEGATFLSEILGLDPPVAFGHFQMVSVGNGVSLDFYSMPVGEKAQSQHYAFLISEAEFDVIFGRIVERGLDYWADPRQSRPGEISTHHGRGCYFLDPSGHFLEILTRPYEIT